MASPQTEQFLDLLLHLKKTTPALAKGILNEQPQIAYGLIKLLVEMDAVDIQVFQQILADYGQQQQQQAAAPPVTPVPQPTYQTPPPQAYQAPAPYHQPTPQPYGQPQPQAYGRQFPPQAPPPPVSMHPVLASLPEEQKNMIMALLAMSPEQINSLPPTDRASAMQLRATFGQS